MIVVALLLAVGIVVATVVVLGIIRSVGQDVNKLEGELHGPAARTVLYPVPAGRDPVDLMVAARHAGYRSIEEHPGLLRIECPQAGDPEKVRALLDNA
ncbi:hypothetical protein [Nocardioides caricicola]|uniref:Uncharacterized protein n=1 Tax=Nocardioides caricicola TaxID=634770 RepID=A0ABW0N1W4_9ACTN